MIHLRKHICVIVIMFIVTMCSCGKGNDTPQDYPIVVKRFNLGLYVGYTELTMYANGQIRQMYGLYTTQVSTGIFAYWPIEAVFVQDTCTLLREFRNDIPISTQGYVVCGDDLTNSFEVFIPGNINP